AEEEARADLRVGETLARQPRDLLLLRGQRLALVDAAGARLLAGRDQLDAGALGERLHADRAEQVVRRVECDPSIVEATLLTQPLAVEQLRAGELGAETRAREAIDSLLIVGLGDVALTEERARASLDPERPVRPRGSRCLGQPTERGGRDVRLPEPDARLDQLGERPRREEQ